MRCVFDPAVNAAACHGCLRRGSDCISQELNHGSTDHMPAQQLLRDEAGTLASSTSGSTTPSTDKPLTPASMTPDTLRVTGVGNLGSLSKMLFESLPSQHDIERIYAAVPEHHAMPHEVMTMPYTSLKRDKQTLRHERRPPSESTHPVLIARYMLFLASLLQHLHPKVHIGIRDLAQPPQEMAERLADIAISHVISKDTHLGSIEALICIMMESVYHANVGNLRRSWIAVRRAITVAQLMGLSHQNAHTDFEILERGVQHEPKVTWSRIVFLDRFLCLLLGLPQACNDLVMSVDAIRTIDMPLHNLERVHCMVASGILERKGLGPGVGNANATMTASLDLDLQKAARNVPSRWWSIPEYSASADDSHANVYDTGRLFAQVLHYNLLNQLHLPYMLHSSITPGSKDYALVTCVSASREILSRFLALRSFNGITHSCRIIDFIALMAAMTLLLAHLDNQHVTQKNLLAHQYYSDRAMVEQVQQSYNQAGSGLRSDPVSQQSAKLLDKLLDIDIDTFAHASERMTLCWREASLDEQDTEALVRVKIPYFGVIQLERHQQNGPALSTEQCMTSSLQPRSNEQSSRTAELLRYRASPGTLDGAHVSTQSVSLTYDNLDQSYSDAALAQVLDFQNFDPSTSACADYPGLAAGIDGCAFQGVDMAYFDNLMMYQGIP